MILASALLLVSGCGDWWQISQKQQPSKTSPKIPPPLYLGTVQQVYPSQKFVLLRIVGPMPSPGTTLISHPADGSTSRIANLHVSEDSSPRNGVLIADVRSGVVAAGDRIFLYRDISSSPSTDAAPSVNTSSTDNSPRYVPPVSAVQRTPASDISQQPPVSPSLPETGQPGETSATEEPVTSQSEDSTSSPDRSDSLPDLPQEEVPSYIKDIPDDVTGWN